LAPQIPALHGYPAAANTDIYFMSERRRFDVEGLVAYIKDHSRPDDAIWVYYSSPEVYVLSDRHPATRDPTASYLAGYWSEPWFGRAADELAAEQPQLIVGVDAPFAEDLH